MSNKTIVFPFDETIYDELLDKKEAYKATVNADIAAYPELFPHTIRDGWFCYGFTQESVKQGIRMRRIVTTAAGEVWQGRPSFVMPYLTCDMDTTEKMLFLAQWAPDWACARVFQKDVMMVSRLKMQRGRDNIVGTTVKHVAQLPTDLGADEKHSRISGEKVSIATTVGDDCFLGASVSHGVGEAELTTAYTQFEREAHQVQPDYQPETVNCDGWPATRNAGRALFPSICLMQCFLHAILSIKHVSTRKTKALYDLIVEKAWTVYRAETNRHFSRRLRRLREWGGT